MKALASAVLHHAYDCNTKPELPRRDHAGATKQTMLNGETSPIHCCQRLFLLEVQQYGLSDWVQSLQLGSFS